MTLIMKMNNISYTKDCSVCISMVSSIIPFATATMSFQTNRYDSFLLLVLATITADRQCLLCTKCIEKIMYAKPFLHNTHILHLRQGTNRSMRSFRLFFFYAITTAPSSTLKYCDKKKQITKANRSLHQTPAFYTTSKSSLNSYHQCSQTSSKNYAACISHVCPGRTGNYVIWRAQQICQVFRPRTGVQQLRNGDVSWRLYTLLNWRCQCISHMETIPNHSGIIFQHHVVNRVQKCSTYVPIPVMAAKSTF